MQLLKSVTTKKKKCFQGTSKAAGVFSVLQTLKVCHNPKSELSDGKATSHILFENQIIIFVSYR